MAQESEPLRSASGFYSAFDPQTLDMLNGVVEDAWQELLARHSPMASNERLSRELLAHRVMARASQGELDPQKLKQHALWELLE